MNIPFTASDIRLFLRGEYIKRNFEQESPDVDWLKENWDAPLQRLKIKTLTLSLKAQFISDIIQLYHKRCHQQSYTSLLLEPDKFGTTWLPKAEYIIKNEKDWLEKMYHISSTYSLCASELMIPYDIEYILTHIKNTKIEYFPIPNFLENTPKEGFLGIKCNEESNISIEIDYNSEKYDIDKILRYISENLTFLRDQKKIPLSEQERTILKNIPRGEDQEKSYKNSDFTKLLGLLQWDLRLQGVGSQGIKEKCRELYGYNCPKDAISCSSCNAKDTCKGTFTAQLYTALASIQIGDHTSVKKGKKPTYTHEGKKIKISRCKDLYDDDGIEKG